MLIVFLIIAALLCAGCAGQKEDAPSAPAAPPATALPTAAPSGPAAEAVERLLAPFRAEVNRVSSQTGEYNPGAIPEEILTQMGRDAAAAEAQPQEGRFRFSVQQSGNYAYQATAMDLYENDPSVLSATPDPGDDTPQDRQLMGDYEKDGGGLFGRVRAYDVAQDMTSGAAEWTDTLNGETTGHELFSFALREGRLYFVDAAMDLTAGLDGLENQGRYLVAAGYLAENGLDVIEYEVTGTDVLPDPAAMNYADLLSAVRPLTRISDQNGKTSLFP